MARIKVVPDSAPNAEGEWLDVEVAFPRGVKWLAVEHLIKPHIPKGFHLVAVERDPRETLNSAVKLRP